MLKRILRSLLGEGGETLSKWELTRELEKAARKGQAERLKTLLAQEGGLKKLYPYVSRPYPSPPLREAILFGRKECVKILGDYGENIHADQLLHLAISEGGVASLRCLLEVYGPHPAYTDQHAIAGLAFVKENVAILELLHEFGYLSPQLFFNCCSAGKRRSVQYLIEQGLDVNYRDERGQTLLHAAAAHRHCAKSSKAVAVARLLMRAGADVNARDSYGRTPLHLVEANERAFGLWAYLLSQGADLNITDNADARPHDRTDPEHRRLLQIFFQRYRESGAAAFGIVEEAERHAAPPRKRERQYQERPNVAKEFARAAIVGDIGAIRAVLASGFDVNTTIRSGGKTALMLAAEYGNDDAVNYLIESGCDVGRRSGAGYTALTYAAIAHEHSSLKLLLEHGADPNLLDAKGAAALHQMISASPASTESLVRRTIAFLLEHGADPNIRRIDNGNTPLHQASQVGNMGIVELLLRAGARADTRNNQGLTPREIPGLTFGMRFLLRRAEKIQAGKDTA